MADCDRDINEAADVVVTAPADSDKVFMILADGTVVFRTWGVLRGHLVPNDYERLVDDGVDPLEINTGDGAKILPQFAGFRVRVIRGGIPQTTISSPDGYSYTFNQLTGAFTFTPAASKGELFQITAY